MKNNITNVEISVPDVQYSVKSSKKSVIKKIKLNRNNVIQGIIFSEILAKPKALRKKRVTKWT